jgi:hypothetical protein
MDGPVFQRFADESPMAVIAAILLARVFSPEKLDELFEQVRTKQYTQDLLFSTVFDLMNKVVCAIEPSVHSAYQSEEIDVSPTAVYDKLSALEPVVSAELVRYSGAQLAPIVGALESKGQDQESQRWLEGYRTKVLDGSCIDATERRIGELRKEAAAPLPGKALAVLDPEVGLITDFFPCEDGHAQERRLLGRVLSRVEPGELWHRQLSCAQLCNAGVSVRNCRAGGVFYDPGARKSAVGGGRPGRVEGTGRERSALRAARRC